MNWKPTRTAAWMASLAIAAMALQAGIAHAGTINADLPVSGSFSATLSGSGTTSLTSASGNFKQWTKPVSFLPGFHIDIGVSAPNQTVGLSIPNVNASNLPASGQIDLDYDNLTPGTALAVNSVTADLNGAGGSNVNIPFTINAGDLNVDTSLGTFKLRLTVNGAINDLAFTSNGSSLVEDDVFLSPGEFSAIIAGNVTGQLVDVPLIGTINLGTVFTLDPSLVTFEAAIPGFVSLSDLEGGLPPFPNDMLANFAAALPIGIPVPIDLPIDVQQNNNIDSGQSGFSSLHLTGSINATLVLGDPSYSLSGVVPQTLVPEPSTLALGGFGLLGLAMAALRRRKVA